VEHDFTNYPGRIQAIHPYELVQERGDSVVQVRQRCYAYPGGVRTYTNTIISVYEREIKRNGGRDYPETLEKELREAWKREKRSGPRRTCGNPAIDSMTWGLGLAVFGALVWLLKRA
jgi:hypothetical protein